MRMRTKSWARPELSVCPFYAENPSAHKNRLKSLFKNPSLPLHLELGCGKGIFAAAVAAQNPDKNFIAADISSDVLGVARREIVKTFADEGRNPDNILILSHELELFHEVFGPEDSVERIYINFANPWPKARHFKKRLTHTKQLIQYADVLRDGGEVWFKTDDDDFFDASLEYFAELGLETAYITRDLHTSGFSPNHTTEHEEMFSALGIPIKFVVLKNNRELTCARAARLQEQNPRLRSMRRFGEK